MATKTQTRSRPAAAQTTAPRPWADTAFPAPWNNLILGAALVVLVLVVFFPAFHSGFIWDDDQLLTVNPQVQSPEGFWTLWVKPLTADYFPLTSTSLWLEYHLGLLYNLLPVTGQIFAIWNIPYLQSHRPEDVVNGYHMMNVFFHAIVVILTWRTLLRLKVPGAWFAAALFAVHPVCVESVAWISERKNTISQIFFLLSILFYLRFEVSGRLRGYLGAVICFTLSLLAKTSVVMLPFALLLLTWWRCRDLVKLRANYQLQDSPTERQILIGSGILAGGVLGLILPTATAMLGMPPFHTPNPVFLAVAQVVLTLGGGALGLFLAWVAESWGALSSFWGFQVIRMVPFFLMAFVLGVVTIYFQYGRAIGQEVIPIGTPPQRVASACFAAGFYLYSALWPFNLIVIYPQWHRTIQYALQLVPGVLILAIFILCFLQRQKVWARCIFTALAVYLISILPALGLLKMSYMRLTLVADHFQYISIVSIIALAVAAGYGRALQPLWSGLAALALLVFCFFTWDQTEEYHVLELVWIVGLAIVTAASAMPDMKDAVWKAFLVLTLCIFAFISYGQTQIYHSEKVLWSATLDKNPNSWQAHNHLGAALYMEQNIRAAAPHFLKAVELKPDNPESHNNLGLVYGQFGQMEEAIKQYQIAVGIKDDSAMRTNLANAYAQVRDYPHAMENYQHALQLNPDNPSAHCNLGYILLQAGRLDEAEREFLAALKIAPNMREAKNDLESIRRMQAGGMAPSSPSEIPAGR